MTSYAGNVSIWWRHHDHTGKAHVDGFVKDCISSALAIDPSRKSHNASDKYPTMQYSVTEMCTHVHIPVNKMVHCEIWDWYSVGFVQQVYWDTTSWIIYTEPSTTHNNINKDDSAWQWVSEPIVYRVNCMKENWITWIWTWYLLVWRMLLCIHGLKNPVTCVHVT